MHICFKIVISDDLWQAVNFTRSKLNFINRRLARGWNSFTVALCVCHYIVLAGSRLSSLRLADINVSLLKITTNLIMHSLVFFKTRPSCQIPAIFTFICIWKRKWHNSFNQLKNHIQYTRKNIVKLSHLTSTHIPCQIIYHLYDH